MSKQREITFKAHFDPNKKCVFLDGEGAAELKLTTDESQIVEVIKSFAFLRGKLIEVTFRELNEDVENARRSEKKKIIR